MKVDEKRIKELRDRLRHVQRYSEEWGEVHRELREIHNEVSRKRKEREVKE